MPAGPVRIVGLGDSITAGYLCPCPPFIDDYGDLAAATLGRPVDVTNLGVSGDTSDGLLAKLRATAAWRDAVGAADIVTLLIGFNDLGDCVAGSEARYQAAIAGVARNIDATLAEVADLQGDHRHAVRVLDYYDVCRGFPAAIALGPEFQAFYGRQLAVLNAEICNAAQRHAATCIHLLTAFNGPSGDGDASPLLVEDHEHPSAKGHRVIAELIAAAGFEPVGP